MADAEVAELLEKRSILLDGFATKEWKTFPTVLVTGEADGSINMESVVARCPVAAARSAWAQRRSTARTTGRRGSPCDFRDMAKYCRGTS